jgi:hypothetical protein
MVTRPELLSLATDHIREQWPTIAQADLPRLCETFAEEWTRYHHDRKPSDTSIYAFVARSIRGADGLGGADLDWRAVAKYLADETQRKAGKLLPETRVTLFRQCQSMTQEQLRAVVPANAKLPVVAAQEPTPPALTDKELLKMVRKERGLDKAAFKNLSARERRSMVEEKRAQLAYKPTTVEAKAAALGVPISKLSAAERWRAEYERREKETA